MFGGLDERLEELVDLGVMQRLEVVVAVPWSLMVLALLEPRLEARG